VLLLPKGASMKTYLAIDPGSSESAYVVVDEDLRVLESRKVANEVLRQHLRGIIWQHRVGTAAIEMITSYGMPVGAEVFRTCVWIGRFVEQIHAETHCFAIPRSVIKAHICDSTRAKDSNVRQALVDRFAPGQGTGKGTAKKPGWFYGFRADIWQAYALAVYMVDREAELHQWSNFAEWV
jgi:hypothetical protein